MLVIYKSNKEMMVVPGGSCIHSHITIIKIKPIVRPQMELMYEPRYPVDRGLRSHQFVHIEGLMFFSGYTHRRYNVNLYEYTPITMLIHLLTVNKLRHKLPLEKKYIVTMIIIINNL